MTQGWTSDAGLVDARPADRPTLRGIPGARRDAGGGAARPRRSPGRGAAVLRGLAALAVLGILTVFAGLLVTGHYVDEGPTLVVFSETHGLHAGDLLIAAAWCVAAVCLLVCLLLPARRRG